MIWTSQGVGRYAPGEVDVQCRTVGVRASDAVIFLHGYEPQGATNWQSSPANVAIMRSLCEAGALVISVDAGGQSTWGNGIAMASISKAVTFAQSLAGVSRVSLVGQSMGGLNALIWANSNLSLVNSVVTLISVVDLWDVHQTDPGYGSAIDAAYGGAYSEASMGTARNPMTMADAGLFSSSVPLQMWYGMSDALCRPQFATRFASRMPNVDPKPVAGGHELSTIGRVDPNAVAAFALSHRRIP